MPFRIFLTPGSLGIRSRPSAKWQFATMTPDCSREAGVAGEAAPAERIEGPSAEAAAAKRDPLGPLTPREHQIAEAIGDGLTNAEIAERLVVTPGTVGVHVHNIL